MKFHLQARKLEIYVAYKQYDISNDVMLADCMRVRIDNRSYTLGNGWKDLSLKNQKVAG